ncbi:hypothetical protein CW304_18040 [Bacillus sp. UFRGS-B20]|nr:hypothetical protein CW304_18040 [Bacillus sp. UFRGS-B20]
MFSAFSSYINLSTPASSSECWCSTPSGLVFNTIFGQAFLYMSVFWGACVGSVVFLYVCCYVKRYTKGVTSVFQGLWMAVTWYDIFAI